MPGPEYPCGSLEERTGVQCAPPGMEGDDNADEDTKESNHSGAGNGLREHLPGDPLCQEGEFFYKTFTLINTTSAVRKLKLLVSAVPAAPVPDGQRGQRILWH